MDLYNCYLKKNENLAAGAPHKKKKKPFEKAKSC